MTRCLQNGGHMSLINNSCDNCGKIFKDKDLVTVVISRVELKEQRRGFRLKLSDNSIASRAKKIYCQKCIKVEDHYE